MVVDQIEAYAAAPPSIIAACEGMVTLVRARFPPFEGEIEAGPGVRIGLNIAGGGQLRSESALGAVKGNWARGCLVVSLEEAGFVAAPTVDMLGARIDLERWGRSGRSQVTKSDLERAAREFRRDPVSASVLKALWGAAGSEDASSLFVEHGIDFLLERLAGKQEEQTQPGQGRGLPRHVVARVRDYLADNLGRDLRMRDLAHIANMEPTSFAKAFKRSTAMTPFEYLRQMRMECAMALLRSRKGVTEIALSLGYANPSKFAAAFQKVTGLAPREWTRHMGGTKTILHQGQATATERHRVTRVGRVGGRRWP